MKNNITDVEPVELQTDTRSPARLGFWVLVVGFGLFMAWAAWAPLDEGVVAPATVSVEMRRKTIQHLQGGVIKDVVVREGQRVKRGEPLVLLEDGTVRASFETIRQNYLAQRALESRLLAEALGKPTVEFHADLQGANDPVAQQLMAVQRQLMAARQAALRAEMAAGQQSMAGFESQAAGLEQMLVSRRQQAEIQGRQLGSMRELAAEGFAPRNQALQLEQQQSELVTATTDLQTNIRRARSAAAEVQLRLGQRQQEYLREVSGQLAEVRKEVQANQERLAAVSSELSRMVVASPVDGQVVGLVLAQAGGGVVTPGQKLMDIVPEGETLLLDAKVPPQVIDRIQAGENAEVRFSSFADSPTLVVHGRLVSLAGDALTEQVGSTVQTFYLARVELTPEGMKALGGRTLQPGMPAEVLIKTGERSLLTYMLHPLTKRIAAAMTEE
ncbi:MAG: HlyD family type I secretion periplasmic adaptor subunit [Betaproteobacteria bacterium]|nr:HlyD family type I secretion periplasmic adaptor subunit [Betaproteobacteria bacterium]